MALALAKMWGYDNPHLTYIKSLEVADAACKQIAYNHGFSNSTGSRMMGKWQEELSTGVISGNTNPLTAKHRGSEALTLKIEQAHMGYLHSLYQYAPSTISAKATMNDIADTMNDKSHSPSEPRPGMSLHKKQVYRWWKDNRGFKKSAFEKPQSTPEHKANRVKCVLRGVIISFRKTFPYVVRMRNGST